VSFAEYDLTVDLTCGPDTFQSRAEIRFGCTSPGAASFADLHAVSVHQATLNGADLDPGNYRDGCLELPGLERENVLVVEAEFCYSAAGSGLYRATDPADGSTCVYSKAYRGGAPRIFCCFDQPDLRAAFEVSIRAPAGWSCLANAPAASRPTGGAAGTWRFAPTAPIPPGVASLCAGPYSAWAGTCQRDGSPAVPVTVQALPSAGALLQPEQMLESLRQALCFYERVLGVPYPYGKCDVLFVPGFPGLAFSAPGLIAIRDRALQAARPGARDLYLPTVIAHELAHAWIGNLVNICHGAQIQMWLIEGLATYISRTALADIFPGSTPWAAPTAAALPDHAYATNASAIRQLETLIGQQAVTGGLGHFLRAHSHGNATTGDLVQCWSRTRGRDLTEWAATALRPDPAEG
jgi:aminopeptidase N